jgi:FtsH-binding integral membrane protein
MAGYRDISQDKTPGDLAREAFWFLSHTLVAVLFLAIAVGVMSFNNPDPDSSTPKALGTALAFLVPLIGGFLLARIHRNNIAAYVWVSGLIFFSIICVRVLDLPTGAGLCENCTPMEKIWRTFFTFTHGSGLMGGDGLLIGSWIPLSTIGYAIGAKLAIK